MSWKSYLGFLKIKSGSFFKTDFKYLMNVALEHDKQEKEQSITQLNISNSY